MQLIDDEIVHSPSDLSAAADCELALLRRLDELLGLVPRPPAPAVDPMLERAVELGAEHERRVLDTFTERFGPHDADRGTGVARVPRPMAGAGALRAAHERTLEVLRDGADVVHQAAFFDGRMQGFADFCVRTPDGWQVQEVKVARSERVPAMLQAAAYADQLSRAGLPVAPTAALVLGDGRVAEHRVGDVVPVYAERRERLQHLLDDHRAAGRPVVWDQPGLRACGRCPDCEAEITQHRDLLLVARMRPAHRERLMGAGITTIDALATSTGPVDGVPAATLDGLRTQARLQAAQSPPDGSEGPLLHEVVDDVPLRALPAPSPGDVFFDFEGDPLWSDPDGTSWGLEYLFGAVTTETGDARYTPFWGHDRAGERAALRGFLDWLGDRRRRWPDLHVYHYADYERAALLRLAARHGTGEEEVDDLLRAGVLVDLYATVRSSVRISQRSYSIKKLEPLYMGTELRSGEVTTAADSLVAHPLLLQARADGRHDEAAELERSIADYNDYDCRSTWRLRDWLLAQVDGIVGATAAGPEPDDVPAPAATPPEEPHAQVLAALDLHTGEPGARTPDQLAVAALAASVGYHRREDKPFWWSWFDRLRRTADELPRDRDSLVPETVEEVSGWAVTPPRKKPRRTLRVVGRLLEGTHIRHGAALKGLYEPAPATDRPVAGAVRGPGGAVEVVAVRPLDAERVELDVEESGGDDAPAGTPVALAVFEPPPDARKIASAAADVAAEALSSLPDLPPGPAFDLLRRRPPRLVGDAGLPEVSTPTGYVEAVEAAVRALDRSYLAVQGPPGSGKTYVGSHVVARLVASGWRIGVVAQSHTVVDNLLERVLEAGVDPSAVGKPPKSGDTSPRPWLQPSTSELAGFLTDHERVGCVVGGTTWTFSNADQVPRGLLDLLVVEEAGQYSVADTVAVSASTQRLLLLGDPQQLPQVTQGTHPVPVDTSALGWVADGHDTLPPHLGYFLARSWRMHPALCARVSRLSYDDRLEAEPGATTRRRLDGVEPGLHVVPVEHAERRVASPEEGDVVTGIVQDLVGRDWSDGDATRPFGQDDVLVVAPYNAQVRLLRERLDEAGLGEVQVGTVDGFQGREAAVVVVSMTVSSADSAPRGLGFLLSRHRTNVAVSRAQWAAYVVRSTTLTDHLPGTPAGLLRLGGFLALTAP